MRFWVLAVVSTKLGYMYDPMNSGLGREVQLICHFSDAADDDERSVVVFGELGRGVTVNCLLAVRLQEEKNEVS